MNELCKMRITSAQIRQAQDMIEASGLKLDAFSIQTSETLLAVQFREYDFHYRISKLGLDVYETTYNTIANLADRSRREAWSSSMERLKSWAQGIANDRAAVRQEFQQREPVKTEVIFGKSKRLSKRFRKVFNQAEHAEQLGLDEISGMGYRKAVEILIREYLVFLNSANKDRILLLDLGKCIEEFVTDDYLKLLATRSAWLGNDFSHYGRTWKERSVSDLKYFIQLTVRWIVIHEELRQVMLLMPEGRPRKIPAKRSPIVAEAQA